MYIENESAEIWHIPTHCGIIFFIWGGVGGLMLRDILLIGRRYDFVDYGYVNVDSLCFYGSCI